MRRSAAERLRRLRWLLTLLFTTINAVGLIVFAVLLVHNDDEQRVTRLDDDLSQVTAVALRLVQYDAGGLLTEVAKDDEANLQCPQFAVLPGGAGSYQGYYSAKECVRVDRAKLVELAKKAAESGRTAIGYVTGTDGGFVRIGVRPFRAKTGQYIGAAVAVSDAEPALAAHKDYLLLVTSGCALLIAAIAAGSYLLAGRAIRPAVLALEQQELLLAETAHDLRTPVAALRALAETALRHPGQDPEVLPRTVHLASRMGGIIDSLLVRARLAAGVDQLAEEPVWLDQLVTTLVEETPADGASVTVTAAPSLVRVDPGLVQRAISNLLDNALRYGRQPDQPAIVHITVANGRVIVADHGPGVDTELAGEVMDRFRSGSGSSGLGLSIVRWVAQAHGGSLAIYNADEGGAIFELVLPVAAHP
ncbi:sensor histidine kinase [Amycolatopsis sp. H20-H5]|uniref:sensor histidine kinase n=1 Tax=Amycolatopsis sp. H20-H5 TaxID=3046309 RepID=UPI002DB63E57|nr:HAMP domain-containing sensor histidine kinase [Amycolatopsis sp. H20-H5]MEC3979282.1 HAMP domain-containing sensor histidine kinase [Amycolatopsis sp. H20-H5]